MHLSRLFDGTVIPGFELASGISDDEASRHEAETLSLAAGYRFRPRLDGQSRYLRHE
jgi:hypothetical protein